MRTIFLLWVFLGFSFVVKSQIEQEILREAKNLGITTKEGALAELAKRGMTESDARRMAKAYGLDYDEYINKYSNKSASREQSINVVSELTLGKVAVDTTHFSTSKVIPDLKINDESKSYFGYSIFENNPFSNKNYLVGNIDEGYIIAPGDELRIFVWGANAYQAQIKIDLNGNAILPDVGAFLIAGTSYGAVKKKLKNYLGKSFSGLITSPQESFIDVSLTQIRPVKVTVLGEVNTPGPHLIGGFASSLNALYASGGIKTSGSLREVKLYRNSKLIKTIDLYNYITTGSLDSDIRLQNNDILFVPPRISAIKAVGEFRHSGIFELKKKEGIKNLIKYSGGMLATASYNNVVIHRINGVDDRSGNKQFDRFITSVNYQELYNKKNNFKLYDGDEIKIDKVLSKVVGFVSLQGSINRPGFYPLAKFKDLKTLILDAGDSLLARTYMKKVDVFKIQDKKFKTYNLQKILDGTIKVLLDDEDEIILYNLNDISEEKIVSVIGFVDYPKTHIWYENLGLYDVIFRSVNMEELEFKSKILTSRVDLKRYNKEDGSYSVKTYNLDDLSSGNIKVNLLAKDQVVLYSKAISEVTDKFVEIFGYVNESGRIKLGVNMNVEDVILAAGGFKEYADKSLVIINRPNFDFDSGAITESYEYQLNMDYILGVPGVKLDSSFFLDHRDIINVRRLPGIKPMSSITVVGEVKYPGSITIKNVNQSLKEVIEQVGGFTNEAYLKGSSVIRNGKPFILNMEKHLNKEVNFLEGGDSIIISSRSGTVAIKGVANKELLFVWEKGKRARHYIRNSGYLIKDEMGDVFVKLPNGRVRKKTFWRNPKVLPHSTITILKRKEKVKTDSGQRTVDGLIRIMSVATGALTTYLLASKF